MVEYQNMKNCFKNFVEDIKKSLYGEDYKVYFTSKKFSQVVKYLLKWAFVQTIVVLIMVSFISIPAIKFISDGENIENFVSTHIPSELKVEIKDGVLSTGDGEPIFIEAPEDAKAQGYDYLIVVDPTINTRENLVEIFQNYKTLNLVTSNYSVTTNEEGFSVSSLENYPDYVLTQESIIDLYHKAKPYLIALIPVLYVFGLIFITIFNLLFSLISALFIALIVMLIGKIKKIKLSYKESYKIGAYALTPSIILGVVITIFPILILSIFFNLLLIIIFVAFNLKNKNPGTGAQDEGQSLLEATRLDL